MFKRFILMVIALVIVLGGVIGLKIYKQLAIRDYLSHVGMPAVPLNAAIAREESWKMQLASIGTLRARKGIDIRSEMDGVVEAIFITPGQEVDAGTLILQLDDKIERATLKSARVQLEQSRREFERDRALFERRLIAEDIFDLSSSKYQAAQALVDKAQGIIDKKTIRAPFGGTIGIHTLAEGHYLEKGDHVVTLQALDALYLDFNVPENQLAKLRRGQQVMFRVPTHGRRLFKAVISSINVKVKTTTRNVLVEADVENPERAMLLPGMFADVEVILGESHEVVSIPREAVAFSLYGETVYVLESDVGEGEPRWRVRRQRVTTGITHGGKVEVTGLTAGKLIARDSQNKLLDGTPVTIVNFDQLDLDYPKGRP